MESVNTCILALLVCIPPIILFLITSNVKRSSRRLNLPPGSLGWIPVIGHTVGFIRAMRANKTEEWLRAKLGKYGLISKLHIFGHPTVFLHGQAANKFLYSCSDKMLSCEQPGNMKQIIGERNMFELSAEDHRRIKEVLLSFLNPGAMKQYVGRVDKEIRIHLKNHWHSTDSSKNQIILAMPLMKKLMFDITCSLIIGIEGGGRREKLAQYFTHMVEGLVSLPIKLPFTRYSRGLDASSKIKDILLDIIREKRVKLETGEISHHQDLISSMIHMQENSSPSKLSDEEIVHNCILILFAGYDTTSSLLSFFIKHLADEDHVYNNVLNEQQEIAQGKAVNEPLTWEDLSKMKYTWRVALESLRMSPPAFLVLRKALEDIEFSGYVIPRGWQVMCAIAMGHMDESIFANPLKFDPTRHDDKAQIPAYSFIPFGKGPRMCPGYGLARIATLSLFHHLVTGFQWKLSCRENPVGRDPNPLFYNGLPICVQKCRKPTSGDGDDIL